jgi:hypothetical protein
MNKHSQRGSGCNGHTATKRKERRLRYGVILKAELYRDTWRASAEISIPHGIG